MRAQDRPQSGLEAGVVGSEGSCEGGMANRDMWRWLLSFVMPHWPSLGLVLSLSLIAAGAGLAQPYLTKRLIDDGILAGQFAVVLEVVAMIVGVSVLATLLGGLTRYLYVNTSARILHGLRESVFTHLLSLPPTFFVRTRQGDIHSRLDADIGEIQRFVVDSVLSIFNSVVILIGSVLILGAMSPQLTALMFAVLLVNALFLRLLRPHIERLTRSSREKGADISAFCVEVLGTTKTVQAFNGQPRESQRLAGLHERLRAESLRLQLVSYVASAVPGLVLSLTMAGVFLYGSHQILNQGSITLGVLIAFVTYMQRASAPMQTLLGLYVGLQRARVCLGRVQELAQQVPAVTSTSDATAAPLAGRGELELRNVSFAYPSGNRLILRNLSLHLPAGSRVALRGPSGAGKSTLVDLLQRHFDPSDGAILLDGRDLREMDLQALRRMVGVVSQDVQLFSDTALENIRYGRPDASDDEVFRAAQLAGADEFIQRLPQGYATRLGQRGNSLSGGQRQRIALARALLLDPRVLILDESTSGVDSEQEARIHREIDLLFADRTRIFISHRPLAGAEFDRALELPAPTLEAPTCTPA